MNMQTFYTTPVQAQGFNTIRTDLVDYDQPVREAAQRLAAFVDGASNELLAADLTTLAWAHVARGFFPLPCTSESRPGQRVAELWAAALPAGLEHFYWKFFAPSQNAQCAAFMDHAGIGATTTLAVVIA